MSDPVLAVRQLSVTFEDSHALADVDFDVPAGDMLAIIGPNGAGKSTLIKSIMGLVQPSKSSIIQVDRKRLGYVPQHQSVDWSFPVTVRDVVMMGLSRQIGWLRFPNRQHWKIVDAAIERVNLSQHRLRQIGDLSGGQRQRVFIARSLAQNADILLLDEPFAGVDIVAENDLMNTIISLNQEGITILLTTHDLNMAFKRFKRVLAINHRLVGIGTPETMYTPDILGALYGGGVAMIQNGQEGIVFVDDDVHCC